MFLAIDEIRGKINDKASRGEAFIFIIDFELTRGLVMSPEAAAQEGILFNIRGKCNHSGAFSANTGSLVFNAFPMAFDDYIKPFSKVQQHLRHGDTYLLNLTFPTRIKTNLTLEDIFHRSTAPYRLLFAGKFVVFSPECFVRIGQGSISTFPMKGTIRADIPDAGNVIIGKRKELLEHNTIVDLLRNDLSIVSDRVAVKRFRYLSRLQTNRGDLLQVSSEITGRFRGNYLGKLGDILLRLLPAGSVSGAPKERTLQIIREVEGAPRGFYTGVFGYFDGKDLESAVMIRYIEQRTDGLYFRSGGGITALSDPEEEYREMTDKVYVPFI